MKIRILQIFTVAFLICPFISSASSDLLTIARASLADGLYAKAESGLVQYLAINSPDSSPEYHFALGLLCQAISRQNRHNDVIALLDKNKDLCSNGDQRTFTYWRARSLIELGEPQKAIDIINPDILLSAQTNDLQNVALLRLSADAYTRFHTAKDDEKAERILKHLFSIPLASDSSVRMESAKLLYGQILSRRNSNEEAVTNLLEVADSSFSDDFTKAQALLELVKIFANDSAKSLQYANRLSELKLGFSSSAFMIPCGEILISNTNTLAIGAGYLKKAILNSPAAEAAPNAQLKLAEAWLSAGSNSIASVEFKNFLETYTSTPDITAAAIAGQATAAFNCGNFNEASTLFQKAAQTSTNTGFSVICTLRAADSLHAAGKFDPAATIYKSLFQSTLSEIPEKAHTLLRKEFFEIPKEDRSSFISSFSKLTAADCYERTGRQQEAQELYESLIKDYSSGLLWQQALYRIGLLHERSGNGVGTERSAIYHYSRLLGTTTDPELRCNALLGRGRCFYRLKSFNEALTDFKLVEEGGFPSADEASLYHIYALYYGQGQDESAASMAEKFISDHSDSYISPTVFFWLAQYYYNRNDFPEAQKRFSLFTERWPNDERAPLSMLLAAKSAMKLSEHTEAIKIIACLADKYPDSSIIPEARYTQAKALYNMARFEDAVIVLDDIVRKHSSSNFTTKSLILKGYSLISLSGSADSNTSVTNAITVFNTALMRTDISPEMKLECHNKVAECHIRNGNRTEAFSNYYDKIIIPFLNTCKDNPYSRTGQAIFSHAVFAAASLCEQDNDPDSAIKVLSHLANLDLPDRLQAKQEIERIKNNRSR